MSGKNFRIFFALLTISIALQGCTQVSEPSTNKSSETNQSVLSSNTFTQNVNINTSDNTRINNISVTNGVSVPAINKKALSKMPEPKIGSGASDLALIMMVRGKLSSDKDLINSVIVEVAEGNATLTGKVASEDQKRKAEELAKNVQGVKSVKNNLRISQ